MAVSPEVIARLLSEMGEDPDRPGLKDTPKRVARMFNELFTRGDPPDSMTVFENKTDGVDYDQMVVVCDIPVYSWCEHHMVPFFGKAHVAYLPQERIIGLSKVVRIVQHFASRLQVQERLTGQVADFLARKLKSRGVLVVVSCEHMCMSARGVKAHGHSTVTNAIRGVLDKDEAIRLVEMGRRER